METSKNILVTGGLGFIGGNFIRYIKDNFPQHTITCLDKNGYASNLSYVKDYCDKIYEWDIVQLNAVEGVFYNQQFDYIFHFAAESHVDNSIKDPSIFTHSNIVGTQNLIECFRRQKYGKFVHVSTDEVYGHLSHDDPSFTENTPLNPRSPYSASKAASDLLCLSYISTFNCNISITRCCNNYGVNQHSEKFIPTAIKSLKQGKKIPVYGDGLNIREWIHVLDHCKGVWAVGTSGNPGVYNIGSGLEISNIELVDIICRHMGRDLDKSVVFIEDRPGHDFRYSIDSSKIQSELLFKIDHVNFEDEIAKLIEIY